jgi:hypothetical protein
VSRKGGKSRRRAQHTASDQSGQVALPLQPPEQTTLPLLPMEIRIGDRFMDQGLEWEVTTHPASLHGGKSLRARIWRPGLPESEREIEREITWPAHVRVEIRRLVIDEPPPDLLP